MRAHEFLIEGNSISIGDVESDIQRIVAENNATISKVGYSNKSDSIYINIRKPKEISMKYGVLEDWEVLVRVSNHYNDTRTHDRLTADLFVNIYPGCYYEQCLDDIGEFLKNARCERTD